MSSGPAARVEHGGKWIALGMAAMNVAAYGYTMIAARLLGPHEYGAFASLMNLLLVVAVLQLGLQATAARRIASQPRHVAKIERRVLRLTWRAAAVLGLVLVAASPLINHVLRLDSLATAMLLGLAAVPVTVMGGQAGILQGERRWRPLGWVYLASGMPRLLIGTALILLSPTQFTAMLAVAVGAWAPVLVGWLRLRRPRDATADTVPTRAHSGRAILRETAHNSQALLAFFALSNVDLIVARNVLSGHDAGLYAAGLILTKAGLFLPQFLVVLSFPAMSTAAQRRRAMATSLGLAAGLGLAVVAGTYLLDDLALLLVGGADYAEIRSDLWLFSVIGTLLSMLQLLIYSVLARRGARSILAVWLALLVLVALSTHVDTVAGLLTLVIVTDLVLLGALFAASLVAVRRPLPNLGPASAGDATVTSAQ